MILYTTAPAELVLNGPDREMNANPTMNQRQKPPYGTIAITSGLALTHNTPQGECISRILSTDPKQYLDPSLQPGEPVRRNHPAI